MTRKIIVALSSPVATSFRAKKAANSLDIDVHKKSQHRLEVDVDLDGEWNVGLIVGASGSGKTTLAHEVWGADCFRSDIDLARPVIDQFPDDLDYDTCQRLLNGTGLTQVPCWIRPAGTLSNGQRTRAEVALHMASAADPILIDEWTSVVDRTVAKVMSHSVQKFTRRNARRIVLCSCHYDVVEWLDPDWIIDCNKQAFIDRRCLRRSERERTERLTFTVRQCSTKSWSIFSRYHYLSDRLPGGRIETFGLFQGDDQIGFQCFANYAPHRKGSAQRMKMHSNRTVIHPDYAGLGLGIKLINVTSAEMVRRGYDVWAKFSSAPVARAMQAAPHLWKIHDVSRNMKTTVITGNMTRKTSFREKVRTFTFHWVGGDDPSNVDPKPLHAATHGDGLEGARVA